MSSKQSVEKLWSEVLKDIENQLSKPSFETWILPIEPVALHNDKLILRAFTDFNKNWLTNHYAPLIKESLQRVGAPMELHFILPNETVDLLAEEDEEKGLPEHRHFTDSLNPKYSFSSFVIGQSNRFAHAAALAVAEFPAKAYNPLFIYGGVGLGKTHLMHAIGHYVLEHTPQLKVVYLSCEKFTNEFITSIQYKRSEEFRNKYRNVDLLMVDDIQFLAGKEQTQEEFFHTFNALHEANKQIVLSSDRHPREIATLEDRLRSRFEWGLITDIQQPDLETRVAILRKKSSSENLSIPDEVLLYLANHINSNIRELEGALIRINAYASFTGRQVSVSLVDEVLKDMLPGSKNKLITINDIQQAVAQHFGLKMDDFKAKRRTRAVAFPRQVAMYLARRLTDLSLPRIGDEFGGRDHTTVLHACSKIEKDISIDKQLEATIESILAKLQQ